MCINVHHMHRRRRQGPNQLSSAMGCAIWPSAVVPRPGQGMKSRTEEDGEGRRRTEETSVERHTAPAELDQIVGLLVVKRARGPDVHF